MDDRDIRLEQAFASMKYMGEQIHVRRTKLKKSIAEISFVTGLSRDDVFKIECGVDTGNAADVIVVANVLGIDYFDLLKDALEHGKKIQE